MRRSVHTTLRQRVAVLLPAGVLVIMAALSRNRDRSDVQQEAYRLARLASSAHEGLAESTGQLFSALSHVPTVAGPDAGACGMALMAVVKSARRFQNIGVTAPDGTVLCSATAVT